MDYLEDDMEIRDSHIYIHNTRSSNIAPSIDILCNYLTLVKKLSPTVIHLIWKGAH